jgi:hypothetical protein
VERVKLKRGLSGFWAMLYQAKLVRAPMPFWRVVVEAKFDRRAKRWPRKFDAVVTAVFVWARTIEEAEGLASLALAEEGLEVLTADAQKCSPAAAPRNEPTAVARTELGFLPRLHDDAGADGPPFRDARA